MDEDRVCRMSPEWFYLNKVELEQEGLLQNLFLIVSLCIFEKL